MTKQTFIPDEPIYVGFVGPAGVGKTYTAQKIVPPSAINFYGDPSMFPLVEWSHHWLSLPLYSIYNVRTQTVGIDKEDRILYGIHDIVSAVMTQHILFEDMIELIYDLYSLPITNSEDEKPRTFLQQAGDLFLKADENCFARYTRSRIYSLWNSICIEYDRHDVEPPWYIAIVSDIRYLHEAKLFHEQKNTLLIKLEADKDTIQQRLLRRDGVALTPTQSSHKTENSFDLIPNEWYDLVIDTTDLTKEQQVQIIKNFILSQSFYSTLDMETGYAKN